MDLLNIIIPTIIDCKYPGNATWNKYIVSSRYYPQPFDTGFPDKVRRRQNDLC